MTDLLWRRGEPRLLNMDERHRFLEMLLRGASPAAICVQLGIGYRSVLMTLREAADFREDHAHVQSLLTQNVESALYRQVMKGSVPAMTLWLRNRPPNGNEAEMGIDGSHDELDRMSDAELLELAGAAGIAIPPAFAQGIAEADLAVQPD